MNDMKIFSTKLNKEICFTPDHKILLNNGEWKEIQHCTEEEIASLDL